MKSFKFIAFYESDEVDTYNKEDEIVVSLSSLLEKCTFITTNYETMYHINTILGIQDSFRGPIIRFVDGLYTYYYNIRGGYMEQEDI